MQLPSSAAVVLILVTNTWDDLTYTGAYGPCAVCHESEILTAAFADLHADRQESETLQAARDRIAGPQPSVARRADRIAVLCSGLLMGQNRDAIPRRFNLLHGYSC